VVSTKVLQWCRVRSSAHARRVRAGFIPELFRGVGGSVVVVAYDRIKVIFGI
jgi:hypothetical protein